MFILLPAHTMLHFIPLVWSFLMFAVLGIFSDNFYFLCEFTLFCCYVQKPQAPSLSKPVPEESRMSLKVEASAASGSIESFFRVLPLTQQPVNHSLCCSLTCDTQKAHFYREFRVPPVFFPCELLTSAVGMAVLNIHAWWCC